MTTSMLRALAVTALIGIAGTANAEIPDAIAVQGGVRVASLHAEGAQVYECSVNTSGALVWQFREPIATLIEDGKTIGRHYAGPHWELTDGSIVAGTPVGRAPGATPGDIPLLKLDATKHSGAGRLADVTTIQRINTRGGTAEGPCPAAGTLLSVPYAADYVFYRQR